MGNSRIELLLTQTIENLGIVGDVVKVRPGFARNYLLPHRIAEHPSPEKIEALKEARAKAQAELAKLRSEREALIGRLDGVSIKLVRSCNDQGVLYGAVSQRDIADQLVADGYGVDTRGVRLSAPIRRIGSYQCVIQFDRDLRSEIQINVLPDRTIEAFTQQQTTEAEAAAADAAPTEEPKDEAAPAKSGSAAAGRAGAKGDAGSKGDKGDKGGMGDDAPKKSARAGGKGESSGRSGR